MTRRHHDERDRAPTRGSPRASSFCTRVDDLTDQQRLGEGRDRAEDAEHGDDDQRALVLEDERQQLPEAWRAGPPALAPATAAPHRRGGGRSIGPAASETVGADTGGTSGSSGVTYDRTSCERPVGSRRGRRRSPARNSPGSARGAPGSPPRARARGARPARRCSSAIGASSGADPIRVRMSSPLMRWAFRFTDAGGPASVSTIVDGDHCVNFY